MISETEKRHRLTVRLTVRLSDHNHRELLARAMQTRTSKNEIINKIISDSLNQSDDRKMDIILQKVECLEEKQEKYEYMLHVVAAMIHAYVENYFINVPSVPDSQRKQALSTCERRLAIYVKAVAEKLNGESFLDKLTALTENANPGLQEHKRGSDETKKI